MFGIIKKLLWNVIVQGRFGFLGSSREGTSNGVAHYTLLPQLLISYCSLEKVANQESNISSKKFRISMPESRRV
jgi:hypothetical protein